MSFDFTTPRDRAGTGSLKWEKYAGKDILPLWVADMDFASAPPVLEALHERVGHALFGYTLPTVEVETAVQAHLLRRFGHEVEREWLVWLPGLVPALNTMCRAVAEGSAVLTCTPVYPPFLSAPEYSGRTLQAVPLAREGTRWSFDWEALEAAVTPQTKLFLLCNPHNPVGRVYTREELEKLAEFVLRHDLILCSDEVHAGLILDELATPHTSVATLGEEIAARTVTLNSPSKAFNLPGLACAYAVISDGKLRAAFKKALRGMITEVNCFGYTACRAAYEAGDPWRQALLSALRDNRETLYRFAAESLPGIELLPMEATYLAWLDVSALGLDDPAGYFESHGVGLSPGSAFGDARYLRLNFGCPPATLQSALDRMAKAVAALPART